MVCTIPSASNRRVNSGISISPSAVCPPVMATAPLNKILYVMLAFEAKACRIAIEPEWNNVPSPICWKIWSTLEYGDAPIHWAPSPPICVTPVTLRSIKIESVEQPIPPPCNDPSGATVEAL